MDGKEDAWKVASTQDDGRIVVEQRGCPEGKYFDLFRVTYNIPQSEYVDVEGGAEAFVQHLTSVMLDSPYRHTWDNRCLKNGTLAKLGKCQYVGIYGGQSPSSMIANRDFVTLKTWRFDYQHAGTHIFCNRSVQWPSYPTEAPYIRGRSFQTGTVIRWNRDTNEVAMKYVTQSDLKGWIPAMVVNMVTASVAPDMVRRILAAAKAYPKWLKETGNESAFKKLHPDNETDEVLLDINDIRTYTLE